MSKSWPMRKGNERSDYAPFECSPDGIGLVYFLGSSDGSRVKIGYSDDLSLKRVVQHRKGDAFGNGGDLKLLALVRATKHAEGACHEYFRRALVAKREVFRADALIPYLSWLRDQYFVATTEAEFSSVPVMDAALWLPGPGKESDRRSEMSLLRQCDPWDLLPTRVVTGDDYYTPESYLSCIRSALGGSIDLDPASHVMANEKVRAQRFFTKDQNGLSQPWAGRVYLNPPFSAWPFWVTKVLGELDAGHVEAMVMLGATRTLTAQYFAPLLWRVDGFCLITGRTAFWGLRTDSDSPTDGHFLLYSGPDVDRFLRATSSLGPSWKKGRAGEQRCEKCG